MTRNDATIAQNAAADPSGSTWLSANAGSGKTRVLTDRVARLLLKGVSPQNILCLTYTKAAAGEMQNRLFSNLGAWAMLSDTELSKRLSELGEELGADLRRARTLFARAIETPGGLKIQTIHSFCSALLRQFPLEAGVSPGFSELDDSAQADLIADVLDRLALERPQAIDPVARVYSGDNLADLGRDVAASRAKFEKMLLREDVFSAFGLSPDIRLEELVADAFSGDDLRLIAELAAHLLASDKTTDIKAGVSLSALPRTVDLPALETIEKVFLVQSGENAGAARVGKFPTKDLREGPLASMMPEIDALMERLADLRQKRLAVMAAEKSAALHLFANAFLPAYEEAKAAHGVVDFDDLIDRALGLLSDQSLAWVLYRLDATIDHILVDEAQDTSPAQWAVIAALAGEIAAGEGARSNLPRTLFVVGDKKQSIYSFQGADAEAFDRMADQFGKMMEGGQGLARRQLLHSFRSARAVLGSVDATFGPKEMSGVGMNVEHRAFHADLPGRVDVWPLEPRPKKPEEPPWHHPVDRIADSDPFVILAEKIAAKIEELLKEGTIPGKDGVPQRVRAGDILILVQRRSDLFDQIISACKKRGLPMAGADRLRIDAVLAVRDLRALLSFLALPEDDLSLATALRSPLFGLSESDLYRLAQGRGDRFLWAALRESEDEFPDVVRTLRYLRNQADFLRPYELIEMILTRFGGRKSLVARLGPEAEDGIDELLTQALKYEQKRVPTLTGFVSEAMSDDIEVKRQGDTSGELIRIMTIHGAKGLEAPIVILPDTVRAEGSRGGHFVITENGLPLWSISNTDAPPTVLAAKQLRQLAETQERQRLLYVAMTRAKCWLIVCGVAPHGQPKVKTWHRLVTEGVEAAGGVQVAHGGQTILRLETGSWPSAITGAGTEPPERPAMLPAWTEEEPPEVVEERPEMSPSDLGGAKVLPGEGGLDIEAAKRRGRLIHRLLEHLPDHPKADWQEVAVRLLRSSPDARPGDNIPQLAAEAVSCVGANPELFTGDALVEVDVFASLSDRDHDLSGTIDRVILDEKTVTVVDFKTNAVRPSTPEETPEGILRQMGAYLAAASRIWPEHRIDLVVLWTVDGTKMVYPHNIVADAFARATSS